ncbi:MAG: GIY-YIG nuclease family protein [Clostridia bacterium]|nr:GIY-YIG nuclease family protein [Clostridia bacterium]
MYYTYMLRCKDNSIYTGMTSNLERRFEEHKTKNEKCAKYTLNHTAIKLEMAWESETRSQAAKLEYHIKTLTKSQKETLINKSNNLTSLLSDKLEYNVYNEIDINKYE